MFYTSMDETQIGLADAKQTALWALEL